MIMNYEPEYKMLWSNQQSVTTNMHRLVTEVCFFKLNWTLTRVKQNHFLLLTYYSQGLIRYLILLFDVKAG